MHACCPATGEELWPSRSSPRGFAYLSLGGEIRGVCGENGAGKSTLMKLLMGIIRPDSGADRDRRTGANDRKPTTGTATRLNVGGPGAQPGTASVCSRQYLARQSRCSLLAPTRQIPPARQLRRFAFSTLIMILIVQSAHSALGERQIVEIARLLVRDARILILDEPTATLSDVEIERMMSALRGLRAKGCSILYVTHRLGEVFEICDSVTVLRNGTDVATHAVSDIDRQQIDRTYAWALLRGDVSSATPSASASQSLMISNLNIAGAVSDFSLTAPRGQITCIAGQVGAGAAAIIRALAGLVPGASGTVMLDGVALPLGSISKSGKAQCQFRVRGPRQGGNFPT